MKNIVGNWNGKWTCYGRIIENAKLNILLENNYLKATLRYAFDYNNQLISVIEKLGFKFFQGYFHMGVYEYKLESSVDYVEDTNSFFELEFFGDDLLIGIHKCRTENGKALFFRI